MLSYYYGGIVYGEKSYERLFKGINVKEHDLYDSAASAAGEIFSVVNLWGELMGINFLATAPELKVPVYFLAGRHDHNTPSELIERYYNMVEAPHKELIWFERSAHMVPFEEPEEFNEVLIRQVRR